MSRTEKVWDARFIDYINMIVQHPNYAGLPIKKKKDGSYQWLATKKSQVGASRKEWCNSKAAELGLMPDVAGVYADVMLLIHPTKVKVCQICGQSLSLYYVYPNKSLLKSIESKFELEYSYTEHIGDIWDDLISNGYSLKEVVDFFSERCGITFDTSMSKEDIITQMEIECRENGCKALGPGAMSNFPDRFDGFHSYNRCCRKKEDRGRWDENMASYSKDRRAYERWSDGNIRAANKFMKTSYFKGKSADHIGPISLGFVHDPVYLTPLPKNENSEKRDRLTKHEIDRILEIENETGVYPVSWYARTLWEYIKEEYNDNVLKIETEYRDALKQNMANFMYLLYQIISRCGEAGEALLIESFLNSQAESFSYNYQFDENGKIIKKTKRRVTENTKKEFDRYRRIAINAVRDYFEKSNRNLRQTVSTEIEKQIDQIVEQINEKTCTNSDAKSKIEEIMIAMQNDIISSLSR